MFWFGNVDQVPSVQRFNKAGHILGEFRRRVGQVDPDRLDEFAEGLTLDERPDQRANRIQAVVLAGVELRQYAAFVQSPVFRSRIVPHDGAVDDQLNPPLSLTAQMYSKTRPGAPVGELRGWFS